MKYFSDLFPRPRDLSFDNRRDPHRAYLVCIEYVFKNLFQKFVSHIIWVQMVNNNLRIMATIFSN